MTAPQPEPSPTMTAETASPEVHGMVERLLDAANIWDAPYEIGGAHVTLPVPQISFREAAALLLRLDARVKEVEAELHGVAIGAEEYRLDLQKAESRATALEAQLRRAEDVVKLAGELTKLARKEDGPFTLVSAIVWANLRDAVKATTTAKETGQ